MTLIEAFLARFATPLAAVVGTRVREVPSPRDVLPYVTITVISDVPGRTQDGQDGEPFARLQVDCWSYSSVEARAVAKVVRDQAKADEDALGAGVTWGTVRITDLQAEEVGRTDYEQPQDASERGVYRTSLDLALNYLEG